MNGTKNCPDGQHVWITIEDYIIDPTIMIKMPKKDLICRAFYQEETTHRANEIVLEQIGYDCEQYKLKAEEANYYLELFPYH